MLSDVEIEVYTQQNWGFPEVDEFTDSIGPLHSMQAGAEGLAGS